MNESSSRTFLLQQSRTQSRTDRVRQSRSFTNAWKSRVMPSQCRLSSRTDQLTICPMPFILLKRGKFISMAKLAKSCRPTEIGRESVRDRVCQYVSISVVAGALQKKQKSNKN